MPVSGNSQFKLFAYSQSRALATANLCFFSLKQSLGRRELDSTHGITSVFFLIFFFRKGGREKIEEATLTCCLRVVHQILRDGDISASRARPKSPSTALEAVHIVHQVMRDQSAGLVPHGLNACKFGERPVSDVKHMVVSDKIVSRGGRIVACAPAQ